MNERDLGALAIAALRAVGQGDLFRVTPEEYLTLRRAMGREWDMALIEAGATAQFGSLSVLVVERRPRD